MQTNCPEIASALNLASASGNEVAEITKGWSKVVEDVVMQRALTFELKEKIKAAVPSLEYWNITDPHYSPEEGFICNEHKVSMTFPK